MEGMGIEGVEGGTRATPGRGHLGTVEAQVTARVAVTRRILLEGGRLEADPPERGRQVGQPSAAGVLRMAGSVQGAGQAGPVEWRHLGAGSGWEWRPGRDPDSQRERGCLRPVLLDVHVVAVDAEYSRWNQESRRMEIRSDLNQTSLIHVIASFLS